MDDECLTYPVTLAAQDVMPVVLGGLGYWYLARTCELAVAEVGTPMRVTVGLLVASSTVAGPVRKFAAVVSETPICPPDYEVPYSPLQVPFVMVLAPGFAVLSWGVLSALQGRKVSFVPFVPPLALGVVAGAATGKRAVLFGAGGLWAAFLSGLATVQAVRSRNVPAAVLFGLYGVGTLVLPALSNRATISTPRAQWVAQGVNTATQALLAGAAGLLHRTQAPRAVRGGSGLSLSVGAITGRRGTAPGRG
jgi:hypothetical protein